MKTLVSIRNNWSPISDLTNAVKAINRLVPTTFKVFEEPYGQDQKKIWMEYDEVEGKNSVVLFGMWYDLEAEAFCLSRSDTVVGVKLFSVDDLYQALGMRVPVDVNDRVLEYKATGKLNVLFSDEVVTAPTFLHYFLQDSAPKKDIDKVKFFKELIENVRTLSEGLKIKATKQPQAKNILSTIPSIIVRDGFTETDVYAASCKMSVSGGDSMSKLKAIQSAEIVEAEAVRASDGYLDPVTLTIDKTPTFNRITARERTSVKVSVERFPDQKTLNDLKDKVRGSYNVAEFKRFFVEIGKCANKSLEV